MSLHVHCHISGGHLLLDLCAKLRYFIFCKELPVVLKAFVHGDGNLLNKYPELQEALVWVYFHSNIPEYNKVECWGPLWWAASSESGGKAGELLPGEPPEPPCGDGCDCCFPSVRSDCSRDDGGGGGGGGDKEGSCDSCDRSCYCTVQPEHCW
ncbi:PREDICTED: protein STAY-GREEN 1, chloroplastic isoform X1 [Tarenaya hassleriana]|uniref:protein STAY-GREEN 1, chloroplastic isoform X1 n=1 Tax=Tarenaya hassleriana TaxID=28532 RepID=UPI0008FD4AC8|nr:PREDICTED: protein STAY-GREEN 1, chloroplastic isoform X1 [Tarenaya hassleriana]